MSSESDGNEKFNFKLFQRPRSGKLNWVLRSEDGETILGSGILDPFEPRTYEPIREIIETMGEVDPEDYIVKVRMQAITFLEKLAAKGKPEKVEKDTPDGSEQFKIAEDELSKTPGDIKEAAEEILTDPDLFGRVITDIHEVGGVVGEEELIGGLVLCGISRLLPDPFHVLVQAPSCSGKSYVQQRTAQFFPTEAKHIITAMSPQVLYYLGEYYFRFKFVVHGERVRSVDTDDDDSRDAFRQFVSEKEIAKATVINGEAVMLRVKGPFSYTESTVNANIKGEDLSRFAPFSADDSWAQTVAIIKNKKQGAGKDLTTEVEESWVLRVHHCLHRLIITNVLPVEIPFLEELKHELLQYHDHNSSSTLRRAFNVLLSGIESSCLLHFRQRETVNNKLQATVADYEISRRILDGPLGRVVKENALTGREQEALKQLHAAFKVQQRFTRAIVMDQLGWSDGQVRHRLGTLEKKGHVRRETGRKGVTVEYSLTDKGPTDSLVFPQLTGKKA